jgi:hypothetical protein
LKTAFSFSGPSSASVYPTIASGHLRVVRTGLKPGEKFSISAVLKDRPGFSPVNQKLRFSHKKINFPAAGKEPQIIYTSIIARMRAMIDVYMIVGHAPTGLSLGDVENSGKFRG